VISQNASKVSVEEAAIESDEKNDSGLGCG
jgi:hypothetical protein